MIELVDGYFLYVTKYGYELSSWGKPYEDKDGNIKKNRNCHGYYGTLKDALSGLFRRLSRESFMGRELTLQEAIDEMHELHYRIENLIEVE